MKRPVADTAVTVGQIQKTSFEIVQVVRKRLKDVEYIHLPVFRIYGSDGEKGICLTPEQWDEIIPMIRAAQAVKLPKRTYRKTRARMIAVQPVALIPGAEGATSQMTPDGVERKEEAAATR